MSPKNIIITLLLEMANVFMISGQFAKVKHEDLGEVNRFRIDYGIPDIVCPRSNYTCEDGTPHFLCTALLGMNPKCICFYPIPMPEWTIKVFVQGTNGIRNKVALDYNIANMNIVYWSTELMNIANQYVLQCRMALDPCRTFGERELKLSQNRILLKNELTERWPGRVVRHWFLEIGPDSDWESVERRIYTGQLTNFSNMVYPLTEFMGCGGARLKFGFFVVCYFYPAFNIEQFEIDFIIGKACTSCVYTRPTCSRTFIGLCGVDYEVDMDSKASRPSISFNTFYMLYMFLFLYVFFYNIKQKM